MNVPFVVDGGRRGNCVGQVGGDEFGAAGPSPEQVAAKAQFDDREALGGRLVARGADDLRGQRLAAEQRLRRLQRDVPRADIAQRAALEAAEVLRARDDLLADVTALAETDRRR